MDKITKASLLLDAFHTLECAFSEAESRIDSDFSPTREYWQYLSDEQTRLVNLTFKEFFDEDEPFLTELFNVGSDYAPLTSQYATSFLRNFIDNQHPKYLDDLLEIAENLRDEGLLFCSALCVRLYCETVFKNRFPRYRLDKNATLGNMFYDYRDSLGERYVNIKSDVNRLNSIIHDDADHQNNPCTVSEITSYIKWTYRIEKIILELPDRQL